MSNNQPNKLIDVIIPHFNQPAYLKKCLQSLSVQNLDKGQFGIIVVDNGSKELPTDVCAQYANVQLVEEAAPGPGPARNKGVATSTAPLLAFTDSDCIADPDWLQSIIKAFENPDTQIIGGHVKIALVDPSNMSVLEAYENVFSFRQKLYVERDHYSATLNMATRRAVFEKVGGFGGIEIAEDHDWGVRAYRLGIVTRYVPEMLIYHPARESMSDMFGKWDRTIGHGASRLKSLSDRIKWIAKSLAITASVPVDLGTIMRSENLSSLKQRLLAFWGLVTIRLYRTYAMLRILVPAARKRKSDWDR